MTEFKPWPKTARLFRDVVITEKIDGSNVAVGFDEQGAIWCQSRKRIITPEADNFGFAAWCHANRETLFSDLGPGLHFGEWWGYGIQRGYGLRKGDRRLALYNLDKWYGVEFATPGLGAVPLLYRGIFDTDTIIMMATVLGLNGSVAAPGYGRPEGICVYHTASRTVFKFSFDGDGDGKAREAA